MQQAVSNLQEGMPEAALMGAQQVYFDCSQARLELERRISEWQILQQTALAAMDKLYKDIASSNFIPAVDLSGVELPIMIDLDQWSGLPYNRILRQAKSLLSRLRARSQSLTAADLKDLTENGIPRIEKEFNEIIYKARMEVIYSQIQINIADISIQALKNQGFQVAKHGFMENDMRKPYFVTLQNIEGSLVTININPIRSLEVANNLVIKSHDATLRTESELRSRSREIVRSLNQFGLQVGPVRHENRQPLEGMLIREVVPAKVELQQENS